MLSCEDLVTSSRTLHTSGCFSAKVLKARLIRLMRHFHRDYVCLISPNKDETRSQSVAGTAVGGRVFSLVLMLVMKKKVLHELTKIRHIKQQC